MLLLICSLMAAVHGGGGVTKTSGITQFWNDDYKVFEQIYGKTSDKEIYGATLPPDVTYGIDIKKEATDKKERYLMNDQDPYSFGDRYSNLIKQSLAYEKLKKPATSSYNFISYTDFKPISQSSDPETYNYLKNLDHHDTEKNVEFPKGVGGFKPYLSYAGSNPEDTDAYKSIQDILDAHEANKGMKTESLENDKYLRYAGKAKRKPQRYYNDVVKPRCTSGRCRKRATGSYRPRTRPYTRRVKHRIVKY